MSDKSSAKKKTALSPPDADAGVLSSQLNWLNWLNVSDPHNASVVEYPFYSDARFTGNFPKGFGPYGFLNTIPFPDGPGIVNAPIILRAAIHLPDYHPDMSKRDESLYHGGSWVDEIAALISVALGVRIHAGGISREFNPGQDPYGQPCEWHYEPKPIVRIRSNQLILPSVVGERSMDELKILESMPQIDPDRYVNLIRACRSYQNALWIAESEPNLAWLMFVSALETAANDFYETDASPDERFRASKPELVTYLEEYGDAEHVRKVAELIASSLGATKKFRDFTMHFRPDAPVQRPEHETLQVKWANSGLKRVLNKVYEYRSRYLHGGIPFPAPMLQFPYPIGSDSPPPEVASIGLASHSHGGTWKRKDVPINLHCFHYITRGVLLNWWQNALTQPSPHLDQDVERAS